MATKAAAAATRAKRIEVVFSRDQLAIILQAVEQGRAVHPADAQFIAEQIRKAVREADAR